MRQGELLALRWSDIDFDKGTVTVQRSLGIVKNEFVVKEPKSRRSRRTIKLPRFAIDALHEHRKAMVAEGNFGAEAVFCTRTGNFIAKTNLIRKVFKPLIRKANKPASEPAEGQPTGEPVASQAASLLTDIRFHDLRHTHATSLLAHGHSIKAVSQRLGHASIEITLRVYAHVMPSDDAALADGLERMFG